MKHQSGFGWNEESHMAIIDEFLWDDCVMSNALAKNFKGKSFEYWKELSIIVGNDFVERAGVRTAAQLERDIDDVEDVRETIVGLDDGDGVEEIGDDEDFPETPVQSIHSRNQHHLCHRERKRKPWLTL
ncbi:hypothetical protein AMTRI_Chr06g173310 [Amborella trichopoda]